jgi:hypothetical protein
MAASNPCPWGSYGPGNGSCTQCPPLGATSEDSYRINKILSDPARNTTVTDCFAFSTYISSDVQNITGGQRRSYSRCYYTTSTGVGMYNDCAPDSMTQFALCNTGYCTNTDSNGRSSTCIPIGTGQYGLLDKPSMSIYSIDNQYITYIPFVSSTTTDYIAVCTSCPSPGTSVAGGTGVDECYITTPNPSMFTDDIGSGSLGFENGKCYYTP